MLKDSSKRVWDYVLVYKLDRFSRNKYETATHKKTLRDNGVKLLSAMENIPDTPEGIILESLLEGMAEYYSAELSQKVKRGMNESRQKGQFTGGYLIYGYKVVDKKILIDEDKAEVVRYIYSEYAKDVKVKDIIKALTERGILNRGKPFAKNTIYHILENEKYSVVYHYGGQEFLDIYPRIVSDDIFTIVDARNKNNHYGKRSIEVNYLLRKKMYCGLCGKPMSAETGTSSNGEVKRYYKCSGRKNKSGCIKSQINKDTIEDFVISTTLELLEQEGVIKKIAERVFEAHNNNASDKSLITHLYKERKRIQGQIDNFLEAIGNGISTMSTKIRLEKLEEEFAKNEIRITSEESRVRISISEEEITDFILKNIQKEPNQMITALIDKIILYEDKIEIYYNYTNRKSPDGDRRDFLFTHFNLKIQQSVTYTKKVMIPIEVYIYF